MSSGRILLVDDDSQGIESARKILELEGYSVTLANNGQEALDLLRGSEPFDVVVSDVRMPRMTGLDFLRALDLLGDETPTVLMTAFGTVEDAVSAMKWGAVDFLAKPFKRQAMLDSVSAARKRGEGRRRVHPRAAGAQAMRSAEGSRVERLIGSSSQMEELRRVVDQVSGTSASVLIFGESGTGKELVAQKVHAGSARANRPFVALNCAAIPEHLIESELFGHEKGAFTGATTSKIGLIESSHLGTLFLDEIGDMPLALQARLLRVLQEGETRRVGSNAVRSVDFRLIAASHRNLRQQVAAGLFREDLLYRLEVVTLEVPPLRARRQDIRELAYHFLSEASVRHQKQMLAIEPEVLLALEAHAWPGNVRELANVIERGVVLSADDTLKMSDLPAHIAGARAHTADGDAISIPLGTPLEEVEEIMIRRTLEATDGDKQLAAQILGINSRTIYRKLEPKKGG